MSKVIVKNNTARLIGIGKQHNAAHKGVATVNADINLKPGVNEVEEKAWQRAEGIITVQLMMKDGACEGGKNTLEVEGKVKGSVTELPEDEAAKLVAETFDAAQLDKFEAHKGAKVKAAVKKQREVIAKTEQEKAKEAAARAQLETANETRAAKGK